MVKNSGLYPSVVAESGDVPAVGLAGARLLTETIRVTSLDASLSKALSSWRGPWAVHDPGKVMADLAVCVALGGRCLSDVALLRCQGEVFGPVASDPTVCRLVGTLADHVEAVEAAVNRARTVVRQRAWALAGADAPTAGVSAAHPLVIDVDATLVNVRSDKEGAAPTFKKGFGYHPLTAWIDHGTGQGAGECAVIMPRPGNAGSSTAADHVEIIRRALDQAGLGPRPGRRVLVRADGAGGTKETIELLTRRRVSYSVGFTLPDHTPQTYDTIPEAAWTPAYNTDGEPRQGADVAETRRPAGPDRLAQGDAGQPCAASHPTRAPGCASRTWAATGPPPSPPTQKWASSPTSRPATGYGPAARTASAARKAPGLTASPCRGSPRTVSGA